MNPNQNKTADSTATAQTFVLGLWGVRYQVNDVRRSVEFYTKALGFKLDQQFLPAFAHLSIKCEASSPGLAIVAEQQMKCGFEP